jgi:NADPH-dependent 2,4-dienoyl-CoA reductase/sulfur reductase-like enzyme
MNSNQQNKTPSRGQQNASTALERADIVIIGNGIAGLTAAIQARRYDPDKRIVMITDQLHPTINTPALKQYAINKLQREQLLAYPPGTERTERIYVVNAHVEEIHAQSKYLALDGNRAFGYDTLLIATGSRPMGLPRETPGRDFDGVMVLHRLKDYLDLRRRLPDVLEAVVIGGGVHANETVMGLLHWGIRVHWLIRGKNFLSRILDNRASEMVLSSVQRAGAIIHTETEVSAIIGRVGTVAGVITNSNEMIPCQLVLCCTGTRPAQDLAKQCTVPMKFKNGILVDDRLRTSVRDIYAAGDVAALPNPQTGDYEPRAQWYAAVTEGKIAGAMMVGHTEVAKEPFGVQWHATHLGELSMLTVGDPLGTLANKQATIHTDTNRGGYCRIAVIDDRMVGYLSVGTTQPDSLSIKRLIDEGLSIRDTIKPLLKGNFDAREYLTKTKARTVRKLVTGQLPPLEQSLQWPDTGPSKAQPSIQPQPAAQQRDQLSLERQLQYAAREGASYQQPEQNIQSYAQPVPARESQRARTSLRSGTSQRGGNYARNRTFFEEEISPFSGNLPAVNNESRKEPANTYNEPVAPRSPVRSKATTRNLWQYATEETPVRGKIEK